MGAGSPVFVENAPQTSGAYSPSSPNFTTHPGFYPPIRRPELQMTPGNVDQPAPRQHLPLLTFPVHPPPSQFPSGTLHTPYDDFSTQHFVYPPPFPSQLHVYHTYHPPEPNQYPPTQYFPHRPQLSLPHQPGAGSGLSYQSPSLPQFPISSPGFSRAGPHSVPRQHLSHPYSTTGQFGLPQAYQPSACQWYLGPGSPTRAFIEGNHMQVQNHYPVYYSDPRTQLSHRSSGTLVAQSTGSEPLPLSSLGRSSSAASITIAQRTIPPTACEPSEHNAVRSPPMTDIQLNQRPTGSNPRTDNSPVVRRYYHPNPPPNRSEWVMWIGNVPRNATYGELWRFLNQPVTVSPGSEGGGRVQDSGVVSIFLISRSNCAFANYQSEAQLNRAISQFSGRKLRPLDRRCPRLVCRARRTEGDLRTGVGAQRGLDVHKQYVKNELQKGSGSLPVREDNTDCRPEPFKAGYSLPAPSVSKAEETAKTDTASNNAHTQTPGSGSHSSTTSSFLTRYFPRRFFILKSLTREDLDLSTEYGVWATQNHNEAILDQAFRTSKEVTLIFSVNKSGEFYGYGRMASGIFDSNYSVPWAPRADAPAAATMLPSAHGQGVEDLANPDGPLGLALSRGRQGRSQDPNLSTGLFPTATLSSQPGECPGAGWGDTFKVEWLSTERVQFHRTRHLRNPWNHSQEIKVSRDGTELEPSVGRRLVDSWSTLANQTHQ